jgi:outer membrane protein assembly factor BamB
MHGLSWLLAAVILLCAPGCSWIGDYLAGADNAIPPAELLPVDHPITIRKLWDTRVGSGTEGAYIRLLPAIDEGRIYAASHDGVVMALDIVNGQPVWKTDTQLAITAGVGLGDGLVLVGTDKGQVLALAETDGTEVWRAQVSSEILATPRAAQNVVVVRSVDGRFTGFSAHNGERLWIYTATELPALTLRGASAPLLAPGIVIAGLGSGKLLVLSLDKGKPLSQRPIATPHGRTDLERLVDVSEPKVAGSTLYAAAYQGNITAIDLHDGNTLWSRDISSYVGLDADANRVYITDDRDAVWALDHRQGGTLWKQEELTGRKLSTPTVSEDYLIVGDFEGYLHWLDTENGRIVGRIQVDGKGINAAPLARGGIIYVLTAGGTLSALQVGG